MYLKRIEILGFKSFADKTVLDFTDGITAIVGPNGSGKSNIIDAVRWILGEREAKNLRGARAEDLIFAGNGKRPRMGMAQVTITFDNSSGFFPVDYKEVAITRRIERDGNSKYSLNKAEVRLKDIIDFFAKARMGTHGLSIINQGASDVFVLATPAERRTMIEEILGLRQFQLKKHEAQRKLKNTTINLEKVKAMVEELAPHLKFLKRQTAKWEKLEDLQKELRGYEDNYFSVKLRELEDEKQLINPQLKNIEKEISLREKELYGLQKGLEKVQSGQPKQRDQISEIRKRRESLLQERSSIEREVGKLEAKIEFLNSAVANANVDLRAGELLTVLGEVKESVKNLLKEKELVKLHQELENLLTKISNITDISSKQKNQIEDLKSAKDALLKKLYPISEDLKKLSNAEEESAQESESFNEEFKAAFGKVEIKKEEINKFNNAKNRLLFEMERVNLRLQDLQTQVAQIGRNIEDFQELIKNLPPKNYAGFANEGKAADYVATKEDLSNLERKMLRLRGEIAGIGDVDQALIKEAQETETRHNFLVGQLQDLDKAAVDLGNLIKELGEKIDKDFHSSLDKINKEFNKFFDLMFGGGKAKMFIEKPEEKLPPEEGIVDSEIQEHQKEVEEDELSKQLGIDIDVSLPRKRIHGLDMLSGGEKSLVSIAALFALIAVSPPPFLVLDEVDAALDEKNTKRFSDIVREFSGKSQFLIVTHNRSTMESSNILYGVTMEEDGVSKILSLKLE